MTYGTHRAWKDPEVPTLVRFSPHQRFEIGGLAIEPYPVPHDAGEPCQYVVRAGALKIGILSDAGHRSEEHTSELQSLMRISYAVFCLKKKKHNMPLTFNKSTKHK